MTLHISC